MKRLTLYLVILVLLMGALALFLWLRPVHKAAENVHGEFEGTALVITGAGARISQEAALLEYLHRKGELDRVVFITGVSSGALNSVMLNAILSNRYTWEQYRNLMFNMTNQGIFRHTGNSLPVNTDPLRKLLTTVLHDSIGFYRMGDLPIPTSLSVVSLRLKNITSSTYRLSNRRINPECDPDLDLVEVLMASTAFPVAFPPVTISQAPTLPTGKFIDGGAGSDYIPYRSVIEFENFRGVNVEKMLIISRKLDTEAGMQAELAELGFERADQVSKLGISLEEVGRSAFKKSLLNLQREAPGLSGRTFLYIPDLPRDYSIFDFHSLKEQFEMTLRWAEQNDPVPFAEIVPEKN